MPLRWHYPLGLLYDLLAGYDPATVDAPRASRPRVGLGAETAAKERSGDVVSEGRRGERLPWELQVHFTDWPDEQLVRLDAEGRVMHDAFVNSVKEVVNLLEFYNFMWHLQDICQLIDPVYGLGGFCSKRHRQGYHVLVEGGLDTSMERRAGS